jgi:hypothetical protein
MFKNIVSPQLHEERVKVLHKYGAIPIFKLLYMKSVQVLGWKQTHSSVS